MSGKYVLTFLFTFQGWVVDLVNRFGNLGGFDVLKKRFCEMGHLNVPVVAALIK